MIKPDGKLYVQSGVGNLGTESVFDVHRPAAEMLGIPWANVVVAWGDTSQHLPWTCVSGGSQTTHAMTRAAHAAASDAIAKAKEIAARKLGGSAESYRVAGGRVSGGGGSLSLAQVASLAVEMGGKYDGHELPENINKVTTASATALAGQGLMGVARDTYQRDGTTLLYAVGFAEVEVDVETGAYKVLDYTAVGDSGTIVHPRAYGGQLLGRSVLGMSHALALKTVYDQHYGVALATRMYQSRPPTILDIPRNMKWDAREPPRSGDAGRRPRHRRAAGGRRRLRDSERDLRRARRRRLQARAGHPRQPADGPRTRAADAGAAHRPHLRTEDAMALVHDVIPPFQLFQPASVDDALDLLDARGAEAWVIAGGMDSFDWLKDRTKRTARRRRSQPGRRAARHPRRRRRPGDRRDDHADRGRRAPAGPRAVPPAGRGGRAGRLAADPQPGHARRQRLAGHALLVLPPRLVVLPRRRQHLLCRFADGRSTASTPSCRPTAAWRSARRTRPRR